MGIIQGAVNSAMSGTAYLMQMKAFAESTEKKTIHKGYSRNAKKGWETRRAAARESLKNKAAIKQNGIDVAKRMKKGGITDVKPA